MGFVTFRINCNPNENFTKSEKHAMKKYLGRKKRKGKFGPEFGKWYNFGLKARFQARPIQPKERYI
jgi:hypothetical protein